MTGRQAPQSIDVASSLGRSNAEVSFRLIIEAARADALGSGAVKYQRIDGSRPWAMPEVNASTATAPQTIDPRSGLLALLHDARPTSARA